MASERQVRGRDAATESVAAVAASPDRVTREFRGLLARGARLHVAGTAHDRPERLLELGYVPRYRIDLFGARYYLARPRKNPGVRFYVGYFVPAPGAPGARSVGGEPREIYPRIFYKDLSLIWRAASHLVATDDEFWIGKGAVRTWRSGGFEHVASVESTTDLPLEVQTAFEDVNRAQRRVPQDDRALQLVLRNGPEGRVAPYRDFTAPRERAAADRSQRVHGGRRVARFARKNDPSSLRFVSGYEPDFRDGIVEHSRTSSRLYGGAIRRFRILSVNRRVQYLFMAAPRHVWIIPPQALTTELSTYGVRTIDVAADDDCFVPGFEYHYYEDATEPPELVSQIPPGFAGAQAEFDPTRADASRWLDALPVVREFRRVVLKRA